MATEEGVRPKVGNDPIYASELNGMYTNFPTTAIMSAAVAGGFDESGANIKQLTKIVASESQINSGYPALSGTVLNTNYDDFTGTSFPTDWTSGATGYAGYNFFESGGFAAYNYSDNNGTIFMTSPGNLFNSGNFVEIRMGSIIRAAIAGGESNTFTLKLDSVTLISAGGQAADNYAGSIIQLLQISPSKFRWRKTDGNWSAEQTYTDGKLDIRNVTVSSAGSTFIDYIKVASGTLPSSVTYSGTIHKSVNTGSIPSSIFHYLSGNNLQIYSPHTVSLDCSFDSGANNTTMFDRRWQTLTTSGTAAQVKINISGLYGPGQPTFYVGNSYITYN